ncbi:MAG: sulfur carrier protein ThiS [gamma proteobacterium symbiont of Taylorina sp.]|nr:sulfur carrier protein ThiS [gamma proteobacterium symbiont of Taylorina sp.]
MEIFVNGEPRQVQDLYSVLQLLEEMDLLGKRLALEINEEIVPKSRHAEHLISAGDKVEIVNAIGGG